MWCLSFVDCCLLVDGGGCLLMLDCCVLYLFLFVGGCCLLIVGQCSLYVVVCLWVVVCGLLLVDCCCV